MAFESKTILTSPPPVYNSLTVGTLTINNRIVNNGNYIDQKGYMMTGFSHKIFNSHDFDDFVMAGSYRVDLITDYTNAPASEAHGQLLVIRGAYDTCIQLYFTYNSNQVWIRSLWKVGTSLELQKTAWKQLH